jgi:Type II secretion system protein B
LSSILTALKKLEKQAKDINPARIRQQKNKVPPPQPRQKTDRVRMNKRYLVILAALIVAGAAGITISQKVGGHHRKVAGKTRTAPKTRAAAKKEIRTQGNARLLNKKLALSNRVEKQSIPPKKIEEPVRTKKEVETPPTPVYTSRAAPLVGLNGKASPPKLAEKRTIVAKGNEKLEPQVKSERFARVPVRQSGDTKIEIQAIAWSKDPKSRLAVINGLILREGETIDNVMVVHIGNDTVVFEKDREEWKQLFGF